MGTLKSNHFVSSLCLLALVAILFQISLDVTIHALESLSQITWEVLCSLICSISALPTPSYSTYVVISAPLILIGVMITDRPAKESDGSEPVSAT
jgi:hypothetical protein